tara:strand:- start:267 stop:527 length:261 start_codon:yes stop_codon:yes gene_type:complete
VLDQTEGENMKERKLKFTGQSTAQMMSLDAELRLMANSWKRFGVNITIDGKNIEQQVLRYPVSHYKKLGLRQQQAASNKRQASSNI